MNIYPNQVTLDTALDIQHIFAIEVLPAGLLAGGQTALSAVQNLSKTGFTVSARIIVQHFCNRTSCAVNLIGVKT